MLFPQAEFSFFWGNVMPCFASSTIFTEPGDQDKYLSNKAVQTKALKAMLDRGVEAKNIKEFDYEGPNLLENGIWGNVVEESWIYLWNWPDIMGRSALLSAYGIFVGY